MRYTRLAILPILAIFLGCNTFRNAIAPPSDQPANFAPVAMRIHPIFTRIADFNGDNYPDGIDALIEFQDQFGDPTKAAGKIMFELYGYHRGYADPRGDRIVNPWVGSLVTLQQQQTHWNRTSRTYGFQLYFPNISANRSYVLTAMFEHTGGRRYFSRVILESQAAQDLKNGVTNQLPMPTTLPTPTTLPAPATLPSPR